MTRFPLVTWILSAILPAKNFSSWTAKHFCSIFSMTTCWISVGLKGVSIQSHCFPSHVDRQDFKCYTLCTLWNGSSTISFADDVFFRSSFSMVEPKGTGLTIDFANLSTLSDSGETVLAHTLARKLVIEHLRTLSKKIELHVFESLNCPQFQQYLQKSLV
jgi:hypothetical protein